jgi:hypothetical protein
MWATYHLHSDVQYSLKVKLSAALLKKVFQTLSEQVHDHDMVHLAVLSFFVTHKMKERNEGLASQLVNQLALPKQHNVSLHFNCFFLQTIRSPQSKRFGFPACAGSSLTTLAARYSPVLRFSTKKK